MWIYCLIGYLAISSSISYANGTPKANSTKVQDKRQTEHQTRIIQIGNQREYLPKSGQHLQHHHQQSQQQQQQQQFTQEEIPADYLSLLQELQYQQSISPQSHPQYFDQPIHAAPSRSQGPQHPQQQQPPQFGKSSGKQQKVANVQYHLPSGPTKEPQKPQQQQVIYAQQGQQQQQQQEPKFQYISEEEYLQLIKQQEQEQQGAGLAQYQTRGQPAIQHPQRPQKQPKFRPSPAPEHLQFVQPQQQEQYRQRPMAAALQQQPPQQYHHFGPRPAGHARPFGDSSFEKELQRIVDSNKPVHFEQRPISLPQKSNARPHHKQGPFFAEEFGQPQPQPTQATRYVTPSVQSKSQQIQPSQKPKFESPASKYQLVVQPTISGEVIYKNQQQQQPQFFVSSYPKPTGQPHGPTKVKYYTQTKDKPQQQHHHRQQAYSGVPQQAEFQEYLIANPTSEPQNYEAQANVMKIVDPPQLQYEKPTAAQLQQAKEYQQKAPSRSAQIHQSLQQNVPSKSQIFVTQSTGAPSASTPSSLSAYYEQQQQQAQQQQQEQEAQQYSRPENGQNKLNIPLPEDRPLTQEEFQALVDAGFPVVPVPVPVPSAEYEKYAASPQITPRPQQAKQQRRQPNKNNGPNAAASRFTQSQRPAAQSYNRYQQQADASSHSLTYLRPIDHFKSGLHGPQKINA